MSKLTLKAKKRKVQGRKVKNLRKDGILPGNIYGKKVKSQSVQIPTSEFMKVFEEAGETNLVQLTVDGSKKPVLIHNVQYDPVTDLPLHADFLQVNLKEKVTAQVPVELVGESPAEKQGLGTVVQQMIEIEVEALPGNLPDKFEIDVSKLEEVDATVFVKDLGVDSKKVEVKADADQILVKVEPPREEEEESAPVTEEEGAEEGEAVEAESKERGEEKEGEAAEEGEQKEEKPQES